MKWLYQAAIPSFHAMKPSFHAAMHLQHGCDIIMKNVDVMCGEVSFAVRLCSECGKKLRTPIRPCEDGV